MKKKTWKHYLAERINAQLREHLGEVVEVQYDPRLIFVGDKSSRGQLLTVEPSLDWAGCNHSMLIDLRQPEPFLEQLAEGFRAVSWAYWEVSEKIDAMRAARST